MATITSVNNTTAGATYNIHDPATWIGGVVPGPNDTVVFQSSTATIWYLTQNWTIQGISWTVSTNRSNSWIEIPTTVTQNITYTQTVSSWSGSTTPMTNPTQNNEARPYFLLVKNPAGTSFTLNLPGSLSLVNGSSTSGYANATYHGLIRSAQAGNFYLNVSGTIQGCVLYIVNGNYNAAYAVDINGNSGYTEINCATLYGGYNTYPYYNNAQWAAINVQGMTTGGSLVVNCQNIPAYVPVTGPSDTSLSWNGAAVFCTGSLASGVTVNVANKLGWYRQQRGPIMMDGVTGGTLTVNVGNAIHHGDELWTQGYNENWDNVPGGYRRVFYRANCAATSELVISAGSWYGPNNIYNSTSNLNYGSLFLGAGIVKVYGNIYSSTLNRYQTPFYFDTDTAYFYHMSGTAYCSISPILYSTRIPFLGFTGGFYHANVVQSNDPSNLYTCNITPFKVPTLAPNPNYTGGNQISWTYIKGPDLRSQTSTMVMADFSGYSPAESNVRLGTVYGNGTKTGTLAVPAPYQVAFGVATDNTIGTWIGDIDIIDIQGLAATVWNYNLNTITNTTNGAGQRLLNSATIESTGSQIAALGV